MNRDDQIFVLKDGRRLGPFSTDQLLEEIERGTVGYEDACLRQGSADCERVREVLDWDDEPRPGIDPDPVENTSLEPEPEEAAESFPELDDNQVEEDFDDFDLDEEIDEALEDLGEPVSGPPSNPNAILYAGHPSLLSFPRTVLLVIISLAAAFWFRDTSHWIFLTGLVIALFSTSWILLERSTRLYLITPRRVEIESGLIAKSSNEVRIDDIRTINVVKKGFSGLIGVGTVEFASSGGSTVEVSFKDVWAAKRIKTLVRRLQDAEGS